MIPMEEILYNKVKELMLPWNEEGIYAVSFFVYSNEAFSYGEYDNVTEFSISYNTETDCGGAAKTSERRWNYAFWRQDEQSVISTGCPTEETHKLFIWYAEQGLTNIGYEPEDPADGLYPVGYRELLELVTNVAERLQTEGFLKQKFGRPIPIIIHDLEYSECVVKATRKANPNGEADDFDPMNWEPELDDYEMIPSTANQQQAVDLLHKVNQAFSGITSMEEMRQRLQSDKELLRLLGPMGRMMLGIDEEGQK